MNNIARSNIVLIFCGAFFFALYWLGADFGKFANDKDFDFGRPSHHDKFKHTKQKLNRKDENIPWEIENAASATIRQQTISRWLKVASGKHLQIVNNKSIVAIPKWQEVHIES